MPEEGSNNRIWEKLGELTGMAASNTKWLQIGIPIVVVAIGAIALQNYDLNRDVGVVTEKVSGLVDSHKELSLDIKSLQAGQNDLKTGQETLTRTVETIATTVEAIKMAITTATVPPIMPAFVLTKSHLKDSTPDRFVFEIELPDEFTHKKAVAGHITVNETDYVVSMARIDRAPEGMNMVSWNIRMGPFKDHVDRNELWEASQ